MNDITGRTGAQNLMEKVRDFLQGFLESLHKKVGMRVAIAIFVILLLANLSAMVDAVVHPERPYFDSEHIIVGVVTGLVAIGLFGMLSIYVASLRRALSDIKTLKGLLPICSACNKIRTSDDRWHVLEKYISERTEATFTHSLCPECARRLYPEMYRQR